MTSPTLSDALRTLADGGHFLDERNIFAAAAHMLDRLTQDLATQKGLSFAQSQMVHIPPLAAQAGDVGAYGANWAGSVVEAVATEPGGARAMWDGGGGWL